MMAEEQGEATMAGIGGPIRGGKKRVEYVNFQMEMLTALGKTLEIQVKQRKMSKMMPIFLTPINGQLVETHIRFSFTV